MRCIRAAAAAVLDTAFAAFAESVHFVSTAGVAGADVAAALGSEVRLDILAKKLAGEIEHDELKEQFHRSKSVLKAECLTGLDIDVCEAWCLDCSAVLLAGGTFFKA